MRAGNRVLQSKIQNLKSKIARVTEQHVARVPNRTGSSVHLSRTGVDYLYYFLTAIDLFFTAVIFLAIFYFALRYRRRSEQHQAEQIEGSLPLEIAWTIIPLGICVLVFLWGTGLLYSEFAPAQGFHGNLRGGQAVDVEIAAPRRRGRNQ